MRKNNKIKSLKWIVHPIYLFAGDEDKEDYSFTGSDIYVISNKLKEKGCEIRITPTRSTYYISLINDGVVKKVFLVKVETVH